MVSAYKDHLFEGQGIPCRQTDDWQPQYSAWRHGGWYVDNVRYPSGAVGCVSNNYEDKRWRIVCEESGTTFPSRDAAARAERVLADYQCQVASRAVKAARARGLTADEVALVDFAEFRHEPGENADLAFGSMLVDALWKDA